MRFVMRFVLYVLQLPVIVSLQLVRSLVLCLYNMSVHELCLSLFLYNVSVHKLCLSFFHLLVRSWVLSVFVSLQRVVHELCLSVFVFLKLSVHEFCLSFSLYFCLSLLLWSWLFMSFVCLCFCTARPFMSSVCLCFSFLYQSTAVWWLHMDRWQTPAQSNA
jgi:hypothetical protein